jgi:Trk K+ transport system NAD-binding subunit
VSDSITTGVAYSPDMLGRNRRTVYYVALVFGTTVFFTWAYNTGMAAWENDPQPVYRSLEIVIQSFTTTGYGEDAPWGSPQMHLLVIAMQFTGIGLILTAVDVFAVPWLSDVLAPTAPTAAPDAAGHVVVCVHTPRTDTFIGELDARDHEYVLVEPDAEHARHLHEAGYRVVNGDPESTETLANAGIGSAVAVVADAADDVNASIALAARDASPDVRVVTLVEDAELARYHRAAGVDDVLSPRQLLGESLAGEVPTTVTTDVEKSVPLGENFELVELTVADDSDLCGQTFAEAALRERFNVDVVGAWFDGTFETPVDPPDELTAGTRLLVVGESDQVDALRDAMGSTVREFMARPVVLAGYGDSGRAASEPFVPTSSPVTVLDIESKPDVDVVGDARDPDALERAGIGTASTLVLTVADDTTAVLATLIARELNPDLHIVVRATEEENVQKLYRAGADYVQSLETVSGRMLASTVFEEEETLAYDKQIRVVRTAATGLVGSTLVDEAVRTATGCTVVAVVRDDETITDFDPATFTFRAGDGVVVAGTDEAITRFDDRFGD